MNKPIPGPLFCVVNGRVMRETSVALVEVRNVECAKLLNDAYIVLRAIADQPFESPARKAALATIARMTQP